MTIRKKFTRNAKRSAQLSPCKVVPAGDPNPRTLAVYTREVAALLQATHKYTTAQAKHTTSAADWGTLVRTAWFSGKAPCWSADHIAKFDSGGGTPMRGKSSRAVGAITRKRGRDPNCFRSSRANLHTHTVCPSRPGVYTTSRDFGHTHTVKFKKGATVTTSEDYGHTHDFDFSVMNGRDPAHRSKAKRRASTAYTRSVKSKRKLARRATPRCANLLRRLTKLAEASTVYRRAGRNLASRDAWKLLMKVSDLAVKEGCGEVQVSEAIEDGLVAGRKTK